MVFLFYFLSVLFIAALYHLTFNTTSTRAATVVTRVINPVTKVKLLVYDNVYLYGATSPTDWSHYAIELVHGMVRGRHPHMCVDYHMWDNTECPEQPGVAMSWWDDHDEVEEWTQYNEEMQVQVQACLYQELDEEVDAHEDGYIEAITPAPRYTHVYVVSQREYARVGMSHTPNSKKQGTWQQGHRNKRARAQAITNKRCV